MSLIKSRTILPIGRKELNNQEGTSNRNLANTGLPHNPISESSRQEWEITHQLSHKIINVKKRNTKKNHSINSSKGDKNSTAHEEKPAKVNKSGFSYKKSALMTEDNNQGNQLKKRGMHVKLSSIASEIRDPSTSPFEDDNMPIEAFASQTEGSNFFPDGEKQEPCLQIDPK